MTGDRISSDPAVMGGVACIRATRIPVVTVAGMRMEGMSVEDILTDYPELERQDVLAALDYATKHPEIYRTPALPPELL